MFSAFAPVETLSENETRAYEPRANAWGMTSFNEFLVQGADMRVVTGAIAEPNAEQLTWLSPHEAVADLSSPSKAMLLRLHFHPGWSAGARATLSPGPFGWVQVTELQNPEQPLTIRWEGTVWQRWGERLSLFGLLGLVALALHLLIRRQNGDGRVSSDSGVSTPAVSAMVACVLIIVSARYSLDQTARGPFLRNSQPGQLAFDVEGQPTTLGDPLHRAGGTSWDGNC